MREAALSLFSGLFFRLLPALARFRLCFAEGRTVRLTAFYLFFPSFIKHLEDRMTHLPPAVFDVRTPGHSGACPFCVPARSRRARLRLAPSGTVLCLGVWCLVWLGAGLTPAPVAAQGLALLPPAPPPFAAQEHDMTAQPISGKAGRITVSGIRETEGNAVDCPQIRADDGTLHSVSFLSAAIAIGGRVAVEGVYGISTRCRGQVLIVETELGLED